MSERNYLEFENRFRGDRQSLIDQFSKYDCLVDLVLKDINSPKILDIGCGRGEWLQKWSSKISDCIGIELDSEMISTCRKYGLKIIEGDAIDSLIAFADNSVDLITIFHLVEHMNSLKLKELLFECMRILSPKGLLIIETPSIDNILVSTNSFYLDPTHVNHINAQNIEFTLEKIGFDFTKSYYINGGPLQNDSPLKITRILNGTAQDLLVIATKTNFVTKKLSNNKDFYETKLNKSIMTLEAAIDYDLTLEEEIHKLRSSKQLINLQAEKIDFQNEQIKLLFSELKFVILFIRFIKFFLRPLLYFLRGLKKLALYICNKIFIFLVRYKLIRFYLSSPLVLKLANFFLRMLSGDSNLITNRQILEKFKKISTLDIKSIKYNRRLTEHYYNSERSKNFQKRLLNKNSKDIK